MAKSKNHTNHNQTRKAHKNGIKKLKRHRVISKKGMCDKFLLNQTYAKKGNIKALKASRKTAEQESIKTNLASRAGGIRETKMEANVKVAKAMSHNNASKGMRI